MTLLGCVAAFSLADNAALAVLEVTKPPQPPGGTLN
jgi:hypothetical protein